MEQVKVEAINNPVFKEEISESSIQFQQLKNEVKKVTIKRLVILKQKKCYEIIRKIECAYAK